MFTVVVVGVRGDQASHLTRRLPRRVRLYVCAPERVLRLAGCGADLVVCTRFVSHKHTRHLTRISGARVLFCPGGVASWADAIRGALADVEGRVHLLKAC
jgi:hypothetical protein